MPTLSLCLIVRNAERDLERCLLSAKDVVDEIVIVDTGSVDDTRTIAHAYAHRFAEYVWNDDFAAARNASLDLATSDWILVLDADEELAAHTRALIRRGLEAQDVAAYQLLMQNLTDTAVRNVPQYQLRLFRNSPTLRYQSPIHEQIVDSLVRHISQTGQRVAQLPAVIIHYGYQTGYNPDRAVRNQRILRKALLDHPDDPYYLYKLAGELKTTDPSESRALLSRAAELLLEYSDAELQRNIFALEVFANQIQELAALDGDDQALQLCEEVMRRTPPHPLLHYLRGFLHWRTGQLDLAQADLETCLRLEVATHVFYYDAVEIHWRSNAILGELHYRAGYYNRAEACFNVVLELRPDHSSSFAYQLRIQALKGDAVGALKTCVAWVQRTGDPEAGLLCGELLLGLGRNDTARRWLQRVREDHSDKSDVVARADQLLQMADEAPTG